MPRFSANLGFLWDSLPLPDRIRAAAAAGFDAVECHWPYDEKPVSVVDALAATGLTMVSLNTPAGDLARGEFGLAAVPGREREARDGIERALDYAVAVGAANVHVMAGVVDDETRAWPVFLDAVAFAAERAAPIGIGILVEPINRFDRPGYFLDRVGKAREVVEAIGVGVRILFDCYHVQRTEGDVLRRLRQHLEVVGHVQCAAVPDRGEPDAGEIDYSQIFSFLDACGYRGRVGAEYLPRRGTESGLGWFAPYRRLPAKPLEGDSR